MKAANDDLGQLTNLTSTLLQKADSINSLQDRLAANLAKLRENIRVTREQANSVSREDLVNSFKSYICTRSDGRIQQAMMLPG